MKSKRGGALSQQFLYGIIAGLLIGISALALYLVYDRLRPPNERDSGPFRVAGVAEFDGITRIDPPIATNDVPLLDQFGRRTRLSDLRGQHILLTFGFTHCPDICPLTLNDFKRTRSALGDAAEQLRFVFVSVDGKRDTPEALRQFLAFRGLEDILALTGPEDRVREFGAPFGLSFEISQDEDSSGYQINHTVGSFLLDRDGRWMTRYQFGVPPEEVAADLRTRLEA